MAKSAKPKQTLAELQAAEDAKELSDAAKRLEIQGIYEQAQVRRLKLTMWETYQQVPSWMRMPPTTTDIAFAKKWSAALNWCIGFNEKQKPMFAEPKTPLEIAQRMAELCKLADQATTDQHWSYDALKTALKTVRAEEERQLMQAKLIAAGRVVAVERLAEAQSESKQVNDEVRAQLAEEQRVNAEFRTHVLESHKVLFHNQGKLETRSIKLKRQFEHLSAKKGPTDVYEDEEDSPAKRSPEDDETKTQRRPRRVEPSTPTPSAPPRRRLPSHEPEPAREPEPEPAREFEHEREPEASTSSSRSYYQQARENPCSSSTRTSTSTSTSARRDLGHGAPPATASGSPHHVRTRRRTPLTPTVVRDVDDDEQGHPRDERSGRENVGRSGRSGQDPSHDVKGRVREGGGRARKGFRVGEASSSSDEADTEGNKPRRTSSVLKGVTRKLKSRSSRQTAAAAAESSGQGAPLEHDEPEKALDGRSSSSRRSRVSVAAIAAQRTFHPLRSIDEGAVQRGDPPTPTSSASREAPVRSALKRRSIPAQTTKRATLSRSDAGRMFTPRDEAYEVGEDGTPERAAPEAEMRELERICATFDALGQTSDDRRRTPGPASSSGFDRSASPSLSTSPPPSPNVTPRSKSRRRRMIERRESGATNVADVAGMPGAFCPSS